MKVQVLADFITEYTIFDNKPEDTDDNTIKEATTSKPDLKSIWMLHIDGASNAQDSELASHSRILKE